MSERTVLISGGSVAGPALAWWLHRYGIRATIVERSPGLRPGGQAVDLRGPGRSVADRMGLIPTIEAAGTGEKGWSFVDADGRVRAAVSVEAFDGRGPTSDLEILRGDLSEILHERTREYTEYVFDDRIAAIDDPPDGDCARVTFASGAEREFDLVVGADGIGSATRRMVFGDSAVRPLGLYMAYFTIPRTSTDDEWARWYNVPGGRAVVLRPDRHGTTRALLSFDSPPRGFERLDVDGQKEVLARTFAGVGWEAPRILAAMADAPDFYFESIGQVRMPAWTRGRVALVGDAGYCASPISGMGTSLALTGAYLLAGELSRTQDHRVALAGYERVMRPFVERAQDLPPRPRWLNDSPAGIRTLHTAVRVATSPPVVRVLKLLGRLAPAREEVALPDYGPASVPAVAPPTG